MALGHRPLTHCRRNAHAGRRVASRRDVDRPRARRARHRDHLAPGMPVPALPARAAPDGEGVAGDRAGAPWPRPGDVRAGGTGARSRRGAADCGDDRDGDRGGRRRVRCHGVADPQELDAVVLEDRGAGGDRRRCAMSAEPQQLHGRQVPASWVERAACRGRPTALWFSRNEFEQAVAIAVCRRCSVRACCLEQALEEEAAAAGPPYGIRGGLRASERR